MIIQNVCRPCGAPVVTTASKCDYCQTDYPGRKENGFAMDQNQQYQYQMMAAMAVNNYQVVSNQKISSVGSLFGLIHW